MFLLWLSKPSSVCTIITVARSLTCESSTPPAWIILFNGVWIFPNASAGGKKKWQVGSWNLSSSWSPRVMALSHTRMDRAQCETASQIMVIIFFCVVEVRHWSAARTFSCPTLGSLPLWMDVNSFLWGWSPAALLFGDVLRCQNLKLTSFPSMFILSWPSGFILE